MKALRNISILGEHKDTIFFTHLCSCGCGEQVTLEVASPEDLELITIDFTVIAKAHNNAYSTNIIKQFLLETSWRIRTTLKVLFKGEIALQTGIIIDSEQGIQDYLESLKEAVKVFKQ